MKFFKSLRFLLIVISVSILAGCSGIIQSKKEPASSTTGIFYCLPKGIVQLKFMPSGSKDDKPLLQIITKYVPDPELRFNLYYKKNTAYDDNINICVSKEGLLKSVDVTTEDRTKDVIVTVVETAKEIAKFVMAFPGGELRGKDSSQIRYFDIAFDPKDFIVDGKGEAKLQTSEAGEKLQGVGIRELKIIRMFDFSKVKVADADTENNHNGVFYKPLLPYKLSFDHSVTLNSPTEDKKTVKSTEYVNHYELIVFLPNEAPVVAVDVERAFFVKKVTKLAFADGILESVQIAKPSELLASARLPLEIVKSITSIPSEIIQLKIDYSSDNRKLYEAQKQEIDAKNTLIETLKKENENSEKSGGGAPD